MLVANVVRFAHRLGDPLVVGHQLTDHVERRDILVVVVVDALMPGDIADRAERQPADLAHALGDVIGHADDLFALLVKEKMIVAEVRSTDVPMKVLGLEIERQGVGEDAVQRGGNLCDGFG